MDRDNFAADFQTAAHDFLYNFMTHVQRVSERLDDDTLNEPDLCRSLATMMGTIVNALRHVQASDTNTTRPTSHPTTPSMTTDDEGEDESPFHDIPEDDNDYQEDEIIIEDDDSHDNQEQQEVTQPEQAESEPTAMDTESYCPICVRPLGDQPLSVLDACCHMLHTDCLKDFQMSQIRDPNVNLNQLGDNAGRIQPVLCPICRKRARSGYSLPRGACVSPLVKMDSALLRDMKRDVFDSPKSPRTFWRRNKQSDQREHARRNLFNGSPSTSRSSPRPSTSMSAPLSFRNQSPHNTTQQCHRSLEGLLPHHIVPVELLPGSSTASTDASAGPSTSNHSSSRDMSPRPSTSSGAGDTGRNGMLDIVIDRISQFLGSDHHPLEEDTAFFLDSLSDHILVPIMQRLHDRMSRVIFNGSNPYTLHLTFTDDGNVTWSMENNNQLTVSLKRQPRVRMIGDMVLGVIRAYFFRYRDMSKEEKDQLDILIMEAKLEACRSAMTVISSDVNHSVEETLPKRIEHMLKYVFWYVNYIVLNKRLPTKLTIHIANENERSSCPTMTIDDRTCVIHFQGGRTLSFYVKTLMEMMLKNAKSRLNCNAHRSIETFARMIQKAIEGTVCHIGEQDDPLILFLRDTYMDLNENVVQDALPTNLHVGFTCHDSHILSHSNDVINMDMNVALRDNPVRLVEEMLNLLKQHYVTLCNGAEPPPDETWTRFGLAAQREALFSDLSIVDSDEDEEEEDTQTDVHDSQDKRFITEIKKIYILANKDIFSGRLPKNVRVILKMMSCHPTIAMKRINQGMMNLYVDKRLVRDGRKWVSVLTHNMSRTLTRHDGIGTLEKDEILKKRQKFLIKYRY